MAHVYRKIKEGFTKRGPSEVWSCVKVKVAILGSPSLTVLMVSVDIKQHWTKCRDFRAQEVCESQSGRPGLHIPNRPYALCGCKATLNLNLKSGRRRVGGLLSEWSVRSRSTLLTLYSLLTPYSLLTLWAVQCPHSVIYHSDHFICVTFPSVQWLTSSLLHQYSCEINFFSIVLLTNILLLLHDNMIENAAILH